MEPLAQLIIDQGLQSDADAGNWISISNALAAQTVQLRHGTRTTNQVFAALGADARAIISKLDADPIGKAGLARLHAEGLDFAEPVTAASLADLVAAGVITQDEADRFTAMSLEMISPASNAGLPDPAPEEVEAQWGKYTLRRDYDSGLNVAVNEAYANGDRVGMVAALRALADSLEA